MVPAALTVGEAIFCFFSRVPSQNYSYTCNDYSLVHLPGVIGRLASLSLYNYMVLLLTVKYA